MGSAPNDRDQGPLLRAALFRVMFPFAHAQVPNSAALERDSSLIEDGVQKRVIVATPITLIALLKAAEFGWRQQKVTENTEQISKLGADLYDRICTMANHFAEMGTSLRSAVDNYNKTLGSLEARVLVSGRKFKTLGTADDSKEVRVAEQIEVIPRKLQASELQQFDSADGSRC